MRLFSARLAWAEAGTPFTPHSGLVFATACPRVDHQTLRLKPTPDKTEQILNLACSRTTCGGDRANWRRSC
eukprot:2645146-Pleurochrysis_carterae.AAC.1